MSTSNPSIRHLLANNKAWAAQQTLHTPDFFSKLANIQRPEYLWIGCSDSRVPSTTLVNLLPGQMFEHRNIANQVIHSDFNCLSVLQFAVDVLKVKHIIICGHYSCGGIMAALENMRFGIVDNWLRHIQDTHRKYASQLEGLEGKPRADRLTEFNVIEQVLNIAQSTVVQDAWARNQELSVNGMVYNVADGLLKPLATSLTAEHAEAALAGTLTLTF